MLGRSTQNLSRRDDPCSHLLHGHLHADPPGGSDQHPSGGKTQHLLGQSRHGQGVLHALTPGAGIRVTAVDHHGLGDPLGYSGDADLHWRGANLVRREETRHRRRSLADQ